MKNKKNKKIILAVFALLVGFAAVNSVFISTGSTETSTLTGVADTPIKKRTWREKWTNVYDSTKAKLNETKQRIQQSDAYKQVKSSVKDAYNQSRDSVKKVWNDEIVPLKNKVATTFAQAGQSILKSGQDVIAATAAGITNQTKNLIEKGTKGVNNLTQAAVKGVADVSNAATKWIEKNVGSAEAKAAAVEIHAQVGESARDIIEQAQDTAADHASHVIKAAGSGEEAAG